MTAQPIRDMSWSNLIAKCRADPLWAANKLVTLDKIVNDTLAQSENMEQLDRDLARLRDILDGKG